MKNYIRRVMPAATIIVVALLLAAALMNFPAGNNKSSIADATEEMTLEEYADWARLRSREAVRNNIKVNTWEELGDLKNTLYNAGTMYQSVPAIASYTDIIVRGKVVGYDLYKFTFNGYDALLFVTEIEVYEVISRPVCEAPATIDPALDVVISEDEVRSEVASVKAGDILRVKISLNTSGFEEKNGEIIPIVCERSSCFRPYDQMAFLLNYDRYDSFAGLADYMLPCIYETCFPVHGRGTAVSSDECVAYSVLGRTFQGKEWDCQDVSKLLIDVRLEHSGELLNTRKYAGGWASCPREE